MFFFVVDSLEVPQKPLTKSEGQRKRRSGVAVQWRGTPILDDWAAFIVTGGRSTRSIRADHPSERRLNALLAGSKTSRSGRSCGSRRADASTSPRRSRPPTA